MARRPAFTAVATVLAPDQRRLAPRDAAHSRSPPPHPSRWQERWRQRDGRRSRASSTRRS
eukprot:6661300-Prymnesium_polylepis.1